MSESNYDHDPESKIKAAKKSHDDIDAAICQHVSDLGIDGIVTGWNIVASIASIDGETEFDGMYSSQSNGLSKWSLIGLLRMALKGAEEDGYIVE